MVHGRQVSGGCEGGLYLSATKSFVLTCQWKGPQVLAKTLEYALGTQHANVEY